MATRQVSKQDKATHNRIRELVRKEVVRQFESTNRFTIDAGISRADFIKWVNGQQSISLDLLLKILRVLDIETILKVKEDT